MRKVHSSSFRDPSGYVFVENGKIKRFITPLYFKQFNALNNSGFYLNLFKHNLVIPHKILSKSQESIIIEPEQIPFITYPYEWSFDMYKEAALLTLKLQKYSLEHGFSLKDASAFNITFYKGSAVFIDTLSFDFYKENTPWRAFKQFITHFFGPLILAHFHGADQLKLIGTFIDGLPLKMISSMLPFVTKLNPVLSTNIHLLAKFESKHNEGYNEKPHKTELSKNGQLKIIRSLYDYIKKLELKENSEWGSYYQKTNYSDEAFVEKSKIINKWVSNLNVKSLIDIGGNDGTFVRRIDNDITLGLICDVDNNAVDHNYRTIKRHNEMNLLPFVLDVLNPSASIGLNSQERDSFLHRIAKFNPDLTLALALIHHISLSGNVPFIESAKFFSFFSMYLIIEFPKREDSWVQHLLKSKRDFKDHFDFYNIENFEEAYLEFFEVVDKINVGDSKRVLFLLKNRMN